DGNIYVVGGNDGVNVLKKVASITPDTFHANANALLVNQLYQDLLHRPADATGQAFWTGLLDDKKLNGVGLLLLFEGSLEYRVKEVQALYQKLLNRTLDPTGLANFTTQLGQGAVITQVEATILSSDEYFQTRARGPTDGFLT